MDQPMKTTSLFMNGRSQAVRLPAAFRFDCERVFIHRDPRTGHVVLSETPPNNSWENFMALRAELGCAPEDFLKDRNQSAQTRDPFSSWSESE
jgi:antitoxin VapB